MREIDPRGDHPEAGDVGPRDYGAEVSAIVEIVQQNPDDASSLQRLAALADEWVVVEGLGAPERSESSARVALARWLSSLVPDGRVVHYGWREGAVAEALAGAGADVRSYLDHTGRAVAAAVRHGSDRLSFSIWSEAAVEEPLSTDLVVVETAGIQPVASMDAVRRLLRPDGWLAILGLPTVADTVHWSEAGCFVIDESRGVIPAKPGTAEVMISLFRPVTARTDVAPSTELIALGSGATAGPAGSDVVAQFKQLVARKLQDSS